MATATFKIVHKHAHQEFQVEVYENGIRNEARTYYTEWRDDAEQTMAAMILEEANNAV